MELRCVSTSDGPSNETFSDLEKKESEAEASGSAIGSGRKNGLSKESGHSIMNSVNKIASQIKKPPHRRSGSPLNWFPRKKTDSFLKRKIRLLQEDGGMNLSLDETLGNAYPHYTKIAREKIAAREAARKAMEARKAAMVEASWCRILRAARIQSKEAEAELEKAEKCAAEAFEAATAMGVMLYDRSDCPRRPCEVETSAAIGGGSTHTVTASFETAFQVDKEVMAAVKKAFIQLANVNSSNKEEFKDLLWKISQNPDTSETNTELSECEFDAHLSGDDAVDERGTEMRQKKHVSWQLPNDCDSNSSKSFTELVNAMLDRLEGLQEYELASLAIIVATCGLNAALLEVENSKDHELCTLGSTVRQGTRARRNSGITRFMDGCLKRKDVTEVPGLDKFLVKHVSRLEREVQEARNSRCQQTLGASELQDAESKLTLSEPTSGLGSILVKHVSKLEKDIQEAKESQKNNSLLENGRTIALSMPHEKGSKELGNSQGLTEDMQQPDMELHETVSSFPFKENIDFNTLMSSSITKKEKHQARELAEITNGTSSGVEVSMEQEWIKSTPVKHISRIERAKLEVLRAFSSEEQTGLDKILVKPVHRLEREKMQVLERGSEYAMQRDLRKQGTDVTASESLDKILVKHVSRLEKEKLALGGTKEGVMTVKKRDQQLEKMESLDEILVKHQSKLEKAKFAAAQQPVDEIIKHREQGTDVTAAESLDLRKQGADVTASESLDKVLVKHVSRLEKEKLALGTKEGALTVKKRDQQLEKMESLDEILVKHQSKLEKAKLAAAQQPVDEIIKHRKQGTDVTAAESLDKILVMHRPKIEKAKLAAAQQSEGYINHADARREARERELQEAWGGMSLGNSILPHLSRLERDKAAWKRAEEEERIMQAREL